MLFVLNFEATNTTKKINLSTCLHKCVHVNMANVKFLSKVDLETTTANIRDAFGRVLCSLSGDKTF